MYCPKCSQEQVSDEVRFCSRCGLALSAVRELIASSSSSSALVEHGTEAPAGQLSRSQKGVRKGARMMLVTVALALVVGFMAAMDDDFAILMLPLAVCFLVGFARVLYGVFFTEKRAALVKGAALQPHVVPAMAGQPAAAAAARRPELSPQPTAPIESFIARRAETAEMVQPPSVTEHTTKLLEEEADRNRV